MSIRIKNTEVHIDNKWVAARITKLDLDPDTLEADYMVVFRTSEGAKDITHYKYESLALEKYQSLIEDNFLNYPFHEKIKAEVSRTAAQSEGFDNQ